MGSNIAVTLLVTLIFTDPVKVIPANNNCAAHLGGNNLALDNTASDLDITNERAFLIDISSLNSLYLDMSF